MSGGRWWRWGWRWVGSGLLGCGGKMLCKIVLVPATVTDVEHDENDKLDQGLSSDPLGLEFSASWGWRRFFVGSVNTLTL